MYHYSFDFLANRPILDAAFARDQSAILLTAHGRQVTPEQPDETTTDETTYLCVWNVSHPSTPQKVLICQHGQPTSVCFSPLKASMAFSGLDDGAVCAWDLREATARHQEVAREEDMQWTFREEHF